MLDQWTPEPWKAENQFRVGSVVFATDQGLGVLARSFHDAGVFNDACVLVHGSRTTHHDWYPHSMTVHALNRDVDRVKAFCRSQQCMIFFETPFVWELIPFCKANGVKTMLMPMYECMPKDLPAVPDVLLCPSDLDQRYYERYSGVCKLVRLNVPVVQKWTKRTGPVKTFVHNSGNGGLNGRNGTQQFVEAVHLLKQPCKVILRSQTPYPGPNDFRRLPSHVELDLRAAKCEDHSRLFDEGDAFVFPEVFNGLSLPLQEACASGMLVMATRRFPNTQYLMDRGALIEPDHFIIDQISGRLNRFDRAVVNPADIARVMDAWKGKTFEEHNAYGFSFANNYSWQYLGPQYMKVIEDVVTKGQARQDEVHG